MLEFGLERAIHKAVELVDIGDYCELLREFYSEASPSILRIHRFTHVPQECDFYFLELAHFLTKGTLYIFSFPQSIVLTAPSMNSFLPRRMSSIPPGSHELYQ